MIDNSAADGHVDVGPRSLVTEMEVVSARVHIPTDLHIKQISIGGCHAQQQLFYPESIKRRGGGRLRVGAEEHLNR